MKVSVITDGIKDSLTTIEHVNYRNIDAINISDGIQVKWIAPRDFGHITISLDGTKRDFEFHLQPENDKNYQLSIRRKK